MRIILGGIGRTLKIIPFREFQLHLVPLIPHSAIAKTILIRSRIFIFHLCGKPTFKTTIETKTMHSFDKRTTHFLIRLVIGTFFVL